MRIQDTRRSRPPSEAEDALANGLHAQDYPILGNRGSLPRMAANWIERELVGVTLTVEPQVTAPLFVIGSPRRDPQAFDCWDAAERAFNEEVFAILGGVPFQAAPH